jgi:hypothetical protein
MRGAHGRDAQLMRFTRASRAYHPGMPIPEHAATRTLTLVLPESDWHALRELEPDTVSWLQSRIRERLTPPADEADDAEVDWLSGDDY